MLKLSMNKHALHPAYVNLMYCMCKLFVVYLFARCRLHGWWNVWHNIIILIRKKEKDHLRI
jgi:hypothetical protein